MSRKIGALVAGILAICLIGFAVCGIVLSDINTSPIIIQAPAVLGLALLSIGLFYFKNKVKLNKLHPWFFQLVGWLCLIFFSFILVGIEIISTNNGLALFTIPNSMAALAGGLFFANCVIDRYL